MKNFSDRLAYCLNNKDLTPYKVSKDTGISQSTISRYLANKTSPNTSTVFQLADYLNVSPRWLQDGTTPDEDKEQMQAYIDSVNGNYPSIVEDAEKPYGKLKHVMQVPLVHQYAYAGYLSGFSDPEYLEELPVEPVMVDSLPRGNYMAFEVRGDSMDDGTIRSYPARCKVICREIQKHHWRDKLHIHKWNFIIVHRTDGILLKQITKHDVNTGVLTLHSFNELYEDFEVNLDEVIQIFNVVKKTMEES